MYRDNTLVPSEAMRLLALGILASHDRSYSELASEVRHFTGRIAGPSLDLVGAPLEVLKVEGLIAQKDPKAPESDEVPLVITEEGRAELRRLLASNLRAPVSELNKLIIALKIRFLHFLPIEEQRLQAEMLVEISERELARLLDLRSHNAAETSHLTTWLDHEIEQVKHRLSWYQELSGKLS